MESQKINTLWFIIIIMLVGTLTSLFVTWMNAPDLVYDHFINKIFIPVSFLVVIMSLLYTFYKDIRENITVYEIISTLSVYFVGLAVALGIVNRANFLMENWQKTMKSEQDLVVKNALMDKSIKVDALTDLYNHKTFHDYLDTLIEQSETYQVP